MKRLLGTAAVLFAVLAGSAQAQIYAPVTISVDHKRCRGSDIKQCPVPSGKTINFSGSEVEIGNTELPAGTPVRVATAGPNGPVSVGQTTISDFPSWSISFKPRRAGTVYAAQVLTGGEWLTIPNSQAQANVFVEIVSGQLASGPRLPVFVRGTVRWIGRDGRGRAELRRCRFKARGRCTARRHFRRLVASKRVRRPGTFAFSTRSRRAYGRPLAIVYNPRTNKVRGDIVIFDARRR